MLSNPTDSEKILLDHFAGYTMQALVNTHAVSTPGASGGGTRMPINADHVARTAYLVAEAMLLERRDAHRRLERVTPPSSVPK